MTDTPLPKDLSILAEEIATALTNQHSEKELWRRVWDFHYEELLAAEEFDLVELAEEFNISLTE